MATQEEILEAKRIYDEIIFTQTLNPNEVKRAYKLIYGKDAFNANEAKMQVASYFTYIYKQVDVTDTVAPQETVQQSHSEDFTQAPVLPDDNIVTDDLAEELRFLKNVDDTDGFIGKEARIADVQEKIDKRTKEYKQSQIKE